MLVSLCLIFAMACITSASITATVSVQTIESAVGICLQLCTSLHQCVTVKAHLK